MAARYRRGYPLMETTKPGVQVESWVDYDPCYGGFHFTARQVSSVPGKSFEASGKYASAWVLECDRPSQKRRDHVFEYTGFQIVSRKGLAWETIQRLCKECGFEVAGFAKVPA